jgi:hypothetical protein
MIKVEVIKDFTLKEFDKLTNIERKTQKDKAGELYIGDRFECDKNMASYLTGENEAGAIVVKIIEVEPVKVVKVEEPKKKKK